MDCCSIIGGRGIFKLRINSQLARGIFAPYVEPLTIEIKSVDNTIVYTVKEGSEGYDNFGKTGSKGFELEYVLRENWGNIKSLWQLPNISVMTPQAGKMSKMIWIKFMKNLENLKLKIIFKYG